MSSPKSHDDIVSKLNFSKMSVETKEIFKMFLALFSNLQLERDSKITALNNKVDGMESRSKSIEQKVENFEIQYNQTISTLQDKLFKAESKLIQFENFQSKEVLKTSIDVNGQYERRDTFIIFGPDIHLASENEN